MCPSEMKGEWSVFWVRGRSIKCVFPGELKGEQSVCVPAGCAAVLDVGRQWRGRSGQNNREYRKPRGSGLFTTGRNLLPTTF